MGITINQPVRIPGFLDDSWMAGESFVDGTCLPLRG